MTSLETDLASIRTTINSFLPSRATNTRLSLTRDVRVSSATRSYRMSGLPSYMRIPQWELQFADNDPVMIGDTETVPTTGTYIVSEVLNPTDYSVATDALAIRVQDAAGTNLAVFVPNYTVTIKSAVNPTLTVSVPVYIEPYDHDIRMFDYDPAYRWSVWFDARTRYTDGSEISVDDQLYWVRFGTIGSTGQYNSEGLSNPRVQAGVLPIANAFMKEQH